MRDFGSELLYASLKIELSSALCDVTGSTYDLQTRRCGFKSCQGVNLLHISIQYSKQLL